MDTRDKAAAQKLFATPRGRMDERGWGYTLYRYRSGPADEATRRYAALAKKVAMPRLTPSTHLPLAAASVHSSSLRRVYLCVRYAGGDATDGDELALGA